MNYVLQGLLVLRDIKKCRDDTGGGGEYMLNLILNMLYASVVLFSFLGIVFLAIKKLRMHIDSKLLDKISDDKKSELRESPSYSLMDEETKKEFKKVNVKKVAGWCALCSILITAFVLIDRDIPLSALLWMNAPFVLIFLIFAGRDCLRAARFRKIYEIRAYCADIPLVGYSGSKSISLVYYDYKKMQFCITTIPLSSGHENLHYSSFCWAMAVEKGKSIKVIDVSPREYEIISRNLRYMEKYLQ